jgi:hypothetical protein
MRRRNALPVGGLAVAGAVAAHALTYAVVAGRGSRALLAETGHGYWESAVALALACGVLGATVLFLRRAFARGAYAAIVPVRFALALAATQSVLFVTVEASERFVHGAALSTMTSNGILPTGLVAQVAVALVMTAVVAAIARGAERALASLARVRAPLPLPRTPVLVAAAPAQRVRQQRRAATFLVRGPPRA